MAKTEIKYRVDFKRFKGDKWHSDGYFFQNEAEAIKAAEDMLKSRSSVPSVRVVEKTETVEYRIVLNERTRPESLYGYLTEFNGVDIEKYAWYTNCRLLNLKGLRDYFTDENEMYEEDRHFYTDGDDESVYFVNADGYTWKVCKLTEANCKKLEDCLRKTKAEFLMNAFKRIKFEN